MDPKTRQLKALRSAEEKLFNMDDKAVAHLANLYDAARREIVTALMDWYAKMGSPDTPEELRIVANQVYRVQGLDRAIANLSGDVAGYLRDTLPQAMEAGLEQAERDVVNMARFLKMDVSDEMRFAKFDQQLPATVEAFVSRIPGLIDPLRQQLVTELQYSLVQGDSFAQIVQRLAGKELGPQGASFFRRGELSMELFSRRAVIDSNNASRQLVYEKAQKAIPQMQKQAVAAIDDRTTDCCLRVHGQIKALNEPYELRGTPRFADEIMFPAFHWRCRSSSVAWHPAYEEAAAGTEADTKMMREKAMKQRAESQGG
jgi:hypothetical protein